MNVSWIIVFRTKNPQGNLMVEHGLRFTDGTLKVEDDEETAAMLLQRWNRGIDYDVDHIEGDLPADIAEMVENSPFGTFSAGSAVPYHPDRKMVGALAATVPTTPGVEVVEGQPEGPEEVEVAELTGEMEAQEEVPAVEVISTDDVFLLDRKGLEGYAKGIGIDDPGTFRNDDLLIEAVIARLEAESRVGPDGVIVEAAEIPEEAEGMEFQIPTEDALREMNFEGVVSFALELIRERKVEIPSESFKTKGKLIKALLELEE